VRASIQSILKREQPQAQSEMNFLKDKLRKGVVPDLTRRELLASLAKIAGASSVGSFSLLLPGCGGGSSSPPPPPPPPPGDGYPGTDDQLLEEIEKAGFLFFWEQADPTTGQIRDRAFAASNDTRTVSSIASTGFGLTALCIGDQRGYQPHSAIVSRVQVTLSFLSNTLQPLGNNGFFYHFVDMTTGARAFNSEVSSIDTAILLCGVLTCRQYFADATIQNLATQIYSNVNFNWMLNGGTTLSMGWTPEKGFLTARWDHYSELMMLYLLAMAAPNPAFAIPAASWNAWTRPVIQYKGLSYISGSDPLFVHQYSHAWFNFRNKKDAFADYFQNSVTATQAHRLFCMSLSSQFSDYSADLWGITASDSKNGYVAWGGPSAQGGSIGPIDGSVVPCATAGSLPFDFADTIHVLRWIRGHYPQAWQHYGYVDAFNPLSGWYDTDVIGIDVGISVLMAENQRTQFVWDTFRRDPAAQSGMNLAGFQLG
jgi:hypothetical protein